MKKIAIIGANSFQLPLILKAKEMGLETHVFAWRDDAVGEKYADYFYPISIIEKEEILEMCKKISIDGIVTIASDLATITVSFVAQKLNLPSNSIECVMRSTNKFEMRKAFKNAKIKTPLFVSANKDDDLELLTKDMSFPLIVKPTDRSGSRGITRIDNFSALKDAVKCAIKDSFEKRVIIEEYINGEEYSCEAITFNGRHHLLAMTKKFTTGVPHFIERAHIEPAGLSKTEEKRIFEYISAAIDSLGITLGASHSEFRIDENGDIGIIEIGARMGGDCIGSHLVELSTGYDYVGMVISCALGESPYLAKHSKAQSAAIRFLFNNDDIKNLSKLTKECPELIEYVSEIENIGSHTVTDSSTRFGYYIMASDNDEKLRRLISQ